MRPRQAWFQPREGTPPTAFPHCLHSSEGRLAWPLLLRPASSLDLVNSAKRLTPLLPEKKPKTKTKNKNETKQKNRPQEDPERKEFEDIFPVSTAVNLVLQKKRFWCGTSWAGTQTPSLTKGVTSGNPSSAGFIMFICKRGPPFCTLRVRCEH